MKTALIYSTKHGTTEKVINYIVEKLQDNDLTVIKLNKRTKTDISSFDKIILGASVYLGEIQPVMSKFSHNNMDLLLTKEVGLFVCGIEPELVRQDAEVEMAFPKKLFRHAQATAFVGGEIIMEKLNPSQKFIVKKLLKIEESQSLIQYDLIDIFIYQMELLTA